MAAERSITYLWDVLAWRASRAAQRMTWSEQGMYRAMLDEQRDKGSLPDCPMACADLLGGPEDEWVAAWPALRRNFVDRRHKPRRGEYVAHDPNDHDAQRRIVNLRMERTIAERRAYLRLQQDKGRRGGLAKGRKPKGLQLSTGLAAAKPKLSLGSGVEGSGEEEKGVGGMPTTPARTGQERAGDFCQWYADAHARFVGVGYIGNPQRDYMRALEMVERFTDEELRDAAVVWFGQDDKFATEGTRTIGKFASRASDLVLKARRVSA